jgi:hypothetical protein
VRLSQAAAAAKVAWGHAAEAAGRIMRPWQQLIIGLALSPRVAGFMQRNAAASQLARQFVGGVRRVGESPRNGRLLLRALAGR